MSSADEPRAPETGGPGGIPWHERRVADLGVRLFAALASPATILRLFHDEAERCIALAETVPETRGRQAVPIRRLPGLEDSSRDWSVYMTLDHLVMVNTGITALLHALCADRNHGVEIQVEDVHPHREAGPDRIDALRNVVDRYVDLVERIGHLRARARHAHPWFGPLNARQWHALAAIHNRTHRVQLERILRRLALDDAAAGRHPDRP